MKKPFLLLCFVLAGFSVSSQTDLFGQMKEAIRKKYPDIHTDQKLIAISFWDPASQPARDVNRSYGKTFDTFKYAKLSGGHQGIITIAVNIAQENSAAEIILNRDAGDAMLSMSLRELGISGHSEGNVVYDSAGKVVYTDLKAHEIFGKINQLITR